MVNQKAPGLPCRPGAMLLIDHSDMSSVHQGPIAQLDPASFPERAIRQRQSAVFPAIEADFHRIHDASFLVALHLVSD